MQQKGNDQVLNIYPVFFQKEIVCFPASGFTVYISTNYSLKKENIP